MDQEPTNLSRAQLAKDALEAYRPETSFPPWTEDDFRDRLTDLLADLMHYANAHDLDFDECLDTARYHYEEEAK